MSVFYIDSERFGRAGSHPISNISFRRLRRVHTRDASANASADANAREFTLETQLQTQAQTQTQGNSH